MSTTIELEQIHTLARNSIFIHTGMDYVIFSTTNKMRVLDPTTDPNNLKNIVNKPEQIKIEDPYFIPKSPIFNVKSTIPIPLAGGNFIEDEFNTGNLTRNLFLLIQELTQDEVERLNLLKKIKLYIDHTSALFIQTTISYLILYPERFLTLKNLDNNSRLVTIQNRIKEKYRDISNAESESITDFILLLIDTLGSSPSEPNLILLLNQLDKTAGKNNKNSIHNWLELKDTTGVKFEIESIKEYTNTKDLFHRLSNSMNTDLISGIPRNLAKENDPPNKLKNDLLRVIIDVQFMEKILDMWKYLLESGNVTPIMISFLKDELHKIFGYFEEAEPLQDGEEFVDISRVTVKNYLDTFLGQKSIAKLSELSDLPSSDATLKIFRSLQIDNEINLPDPNTINFLFTVTFILQENSILSTLHRRSEEFEGGWDDTNPALPVPVNKQRWDLSPKIFPGIIFKNGRAQLLESVELEQEYNRLKNEVTDLDLRIGQVGQLQNLLKTARGIPL